jgi:hypothetical protein
MTQTDGAEERDLLRMAKYLRERHGANAIAVAEKRIVELDAARDHGAAAIWRQVLELLKQGRV